MKFWNNIKEKLLNSEDFLELRSSSIKDILNGNILNKKFVRRQFKLLLLIAVLLIIYIDNRYNCEKHIAQEVKLKQELQDIKFESLTISAELTELSRRTYVLNYIQSRNLDLRESTVAPTVINILSPKQEESERKAQEERDRIIERLAKDTISNEEEVIEQ